MNADDRQQIHDALLSYCRGIDRLDPGALTAAFHPGAELIDYWPEPTTVEAFVERVLPALKKRFSAIQHRISNTAIEVDGEGALVETYVLAYHRQPGLEAEGAASQPDELHTFNGRYIDRFERHADQWRIARRTLRCDWSRIETIEQPMGGDWVLSGRAGEPDPLYD